MGMADKKVIDKKIEEGEKAEKKALLKRQKELMKKEKVSFSRMFPSFPVTDVLKSSSSKAKAHLIP